MRDIWFDLHIGRIKVNEDGVVSEDVDIVRRCRVTETSEVDNSIRDVSRVELHCLLDKALNEVEELLKIHGSVGREMRNERRLCSASSDKDAKRSSWKAFDGVRSTPYRGGLT